MKIYKIIVNFKEVEYAEFDFLHIKGCSDYLRLVCSCAKYFGEGRFLLRLICLVFGCYCGWHDIWEICV